ncbi:MAG TPA: tRNA pseudouridine(38-40) synthase TruA [Nitrospiraceae bacterium]|nr:tRNA pseudouridine(38-40) synthase TruA [Nitrospiraceae bacterium]
MATYKLTLEYDGTAYAGWQRQPDQPTVQAALESVLHHISHTDISVIGAGRTDSGVHALGQVASFRSALTMAADQWTRALNALLPADISVRSTEQVADDFNARRWARAKLYEYRILNRRPRSALERQRAWHIWGKLYVEHMREGAAFLTGQHDFSSFEGPQAGTEKKVCNLHRLDISQAGDILTIHLEADRFLKQMVRAIVGTLMEVGLGKRVPHAMKDILEAHDRRAAGYTAPPHGLYLVRVDY